MKSKTIIEVRRPLSSAITPKIESIGLKYGNIKRKKKLKRKLEFSSEAQKINGHPGKANIE